MTIVCQLRTFLDYNLGMTWIWLLIRSLWTLPTTSVGLFIGLLCTPFGTRWRIRRGVLECHGGLVADLLEHYTFLEGGATAMTLGEVILGRTPGALDLVRDHEHVHVRQARRWGMFFLPAYLGCSVWLFLCGRDAYRENPFEKEAYGNDE
jgi:hypothetical protein